MSIRAKRHSQKRKREGGKKDEFLWLMSLSDLMILLFIFFVVLFAFTYQKVKSTELIKVLSVITEGEQGQTDIEKIQKNLTEWIVNEKLTDQVVIKKNGDQLELQIKDKVLFASGEFKPHTRGIQSLQKLSVVLDKVPEPYQLGIEGHTDDTPIRTQRIMDNWDLSSKRALQVLWALSLSSDTQKRTVIEAYGDTKPMQPNRDSSGRPLPENQRKNRRVTIRIF